MILTKRFASILLLFVVTVCFCGYSVNAARLTTTTNTSHGTSVPAPTAEVAEVDGEENAVLPADDTTSYSFWGIVRGLWNWLKDDFRESLSADDDDSTAVATAEETAAATTGRTFGKIRRLQMALIPIIFKFGILSAMVAFLVVLGMKTLFLVKLLVLMNAAVILAKFLTWKTQPVHSGYEHPPPVSGWAYSNWAPHGHSGWAATAPATHSAHPPSKEIHLHIHGAQAHPQVSAYSSYSPSQQSHGWDRKFDPYAMYEPSPVAENELNNVGPLNVPPTRYPINHRAY